MFTEIRAFKCMKCGRTYENLPDECICDIYGQSYLYRGLFIIAYENNHGARVICKLCRKEQIVKDKQLKRYKGCNCLPSHIKVETVCDETIRYFCTKCQKFSLSHIPVMEWCCNEQNNNSL